MNMTRKGAQRAVEAGEVQDDTEAPIYYSHVKAMCKALSRKGDGEAATRKFTINTQHRTASRTLEPTNMSWDAMSYDVRNNLSSSPHSDHVAT